MMRRRAVAATSVLPIVSIVMTLGYAGLCLIDGNLKRYEKIEA